MSDHFDNLVQEQAAAETPAAPAAQAEAKPRPRRGRKLLLTAVVVFCVLALVLAGLGMWGYSLTVSPRNLPQVYIDGVFVGGMTRQETQAALERDNWDAWDGRDFDGQCFVSVVLFVPDVPWLSCRHPLRFSASGGA